jgi:murein L,D-transpeptidase YcbB/YkuD
MDDLQWDVDSLMQDPGKQPKSTRIDLTTPIPVHILYWTSWTDPDRQVQFREDVYQRDDAIHQALHEPLQPGSL